MSDRRLLRCLRAVSFVLENDLTLIGSAVSHVTRALRDAGVFDEAESHRIMAALDEALTNAYYHGNLEVRSELRARDPRVYRALAHARRDIAPYRDRGIRLEVVITPDDVRFVIGDDGPGFDPGRIPDPTHVDHVAHPTGRGVWLMRAFMDTVDYNDVGNEVTLVKRRTRPRSHSPFTGHKPSRPRKL